MNQQNDPQFYVEPTGLPNALVVPDSVRHAGMSPGDVGHLRDRVAELEAKLAIATENAAQAVKERDELLVKWYSTRADFIDAKYGNADENEGEPEKLRERLAAAEAVCELVDERLTPSFDPKMDDLIARWMKLKEAQKPNP